MLSHHLNDRTQTEHHCQRSDGQPPSKGSSSSIVVGHRGTLVSLIFRAFDSAFECYMDTSLTGRQAELHFLFRCLASESLDHSDPLRTSALHHMRLPGHSPDTVPVAVPFNSRALLADFPKRFDEVNKYVPPSQQSLKICIESAIKAGTAVFLFEEAMTSPNPQSTVTR
jgi:hypothetical protein